MLIANTVVGAYLDPDNSYTAILRYLVDERDLSSVAALLMGLAAGFVWFTRYFQSDIDTTGLAVASLGTHVAGHLHRLLLCCAARRSSGKS